MDSIHVSARIPLAHAEALAFLAREADRSFSAELRLAVADRVARTQTDDEAADTAPLVTTTPAGRGPELEPAA